MKGALAIFSIILILGIIGMTNNPSITGNAVLELDHNHRLRDAIQNKEESFEIKTSPEKSRIFFIDYTGPVHATPRGTDCGPDSNSYKPIKRNIGWRNFPVSYKIIGDPVFATTVEKAFKTWDDEEHPAGTLFMPNENANILVQAAPLDGPGGALAVTSISYLLSGPILTATITFDSAESWATYEMLSCERLGNAFDIEDVAVHEIGHALGLAHTKKSTDVALTMYPYASPGETLKRTLGTGDKRGIDALY